MNRYLFNITALILIGSLSCGCGYLRIDLQNVLLRSDVIDSPEREQQILSKALLTTTGDGKIRVLFVRGSAYERGYQHGVLLRKEIQDNLGTLWENALDKFHTEEIFAEAFERARPFIPQDYIDEMHGLAHGSKLPLNVIHYIHALPEITEWGGKKKLKGVVKRMMDGDIIGTTCSNFSTVGPASKDGKLYTVRILDWGLHRISKLHEYPLITVNVPETGVPSANIGWVGFLGAVSGMNAQGITLGEMGYGDPENETLRGTPMPFLLRDVMTRSNTLDDVRPIIAGSVGTNSFVFLMSDGKSGRSELYIKDRERFLTFRPGEPLTDKDKAFPPIQNVLYGGHYDDKMTGLLTGTRGTLDPKLIMERLIPEMAMPSNFHNVVYDPGSLRFWVNNAKDSGHRAAEQPYTEFRLGEALKEFLGKP